MPHYDDWDAHWGRFAAAATRNPAQRMRHRIVTKLVAQLANGGRPRVVDIGSGQGDLILRLREVIPQGEFVGLELSQRGVEISRRKIPKAVFITADLFDPAAALNTYHGWASVGVCSEVLEHVDDPVAFLRAAELFLGPGARLVVTVPAGPMSAFDRTIGHRRHFTGESVASTLAGAGLEVERVWLAGFPFFNLYRLIVIARGERLATDVAEEENGGMGMLANLTMAVFRLLFRLNLKHFPLGWQIVAVARKRG